MRTTTGIVHRSPSACWTVLTDPSTLTGWMPGLRKARVLDRYPTGLAKEIELEFASAAYSQLYTYDVASHEVRWKPARGTSNAGFAKLEPFEDGSRLTYGLEGADPDPLVKQFVTWMHAY